MAVATGRSAGRRTMSRWRKFALGASAVLMGATTLTACGSAAGPTGSGGVPNASLPASPAGGGEAAATEGPCEVKEVNWWTQYGGSLVDILAQQVDEFNRTHPCIHVTNTQVVGGTQGADSERKFLTAVSAGAGPDLWTSSNPVVAQYAENGAIVALDDYLKGDYAGVKDWLYPQAVVGGSYGGKLYGLPESMNSQDTFYNKAILEEVGATEVPKTLAEFDELQAKMWKLNGNQIQQIGFYPEPTRFILYYPFFGGSLNTTNGRYELANNEGNLALMRYYQSYAGKYPFSAFTAFQSAVGSGNQAGSDPFTAGMQGFYVVGNHEGILSIPSDNPAMQGNFGTMYFPTTPTGPQDGHGVYVNGNYTFLVKDSKNPDAAIEFLMWMTGYNNEDFTAKIMNQVGWLPASPKVVESATFQAWLETYPWARLMVEEFGSEYSQAMENTLGAPAVQQALWTACEAVLTGKMTPEEALASVDKAGNEALASGGN